VGVEWVESTIVFIELPILPFLSVLRVSAIEEMRLLLTTVQMQRVSLVLPWASQRSLSRHITAPEMC
jgi:hypothetical protein